MSDTLLRVWSAFMLALRAVRRNNCGGADQLALHRCAAVVTVTALADGSSGVMSQVSALARTR